MRYFLSFILTVSLLTGLSAQKNALRSFINKHRHDSNASHISLGGTLLSFASKAIHDEPAVEILSKLDHLNILSVPSPPHKIHSELIELRQSFRANDYEELIRIRDGKELVEIHLYENNQNIIEELVFIIDGPEELTVINISGEINYKDLQSIHFDGKAGEAMQHLPQHLAIP